MKMAENVADTQCVNNLDKMMCQLCGTLEHLSLCGGCRDTWYCCKEHQKQDWKKHKGICKNARKKKIPTEDECNRKDDNQTKASFSQHYSRQSQSSAKSKTSQNGQKHSSETFQSGSSVNPANLGEAQCVRKLSDDKVGTGTYLKVLKTRFDMLAKYVVDCLTKYGVCVIDNFLNETKGTEVLEEVKWLQRRGLFTKGQLVNSTNSTTQNIRGDVLTWVDGSEDGCSNIHFLISCMDDIILRCAGQLEDYDIQERTKAMVACYPGNKSGYIKHVDNPNGDGRCVTCIYYLNKDWDVTKHGGMLRIYPEGQDLVANIEPTFDRVLYFWSDRRNPHEVRATYKERYAITIWYYDAKERRKALLNTRGPKRDSVPLISSGNR